MKKNDYVSPYVLKANAAAKLRSKKALQVLRKDRKNNSASVPVSDWNDDVKSHDLFDPSIKKNDIFKIEPRIATHNKHNISITDDDIPQLNLPRYNSSNITLKTYGTIPSRNPMYSKSRSYTHTASQPSTSNTVSTFTNKEDDDYDSDIVSLTGSDTSIESELDISQYKSSKSMITRSTSPIDERMVNLIIGDIDVDYNDFDVNNHDYAPLSGTTDVSYSVDDDDIGEDEGSDMEEEVVDMIDQYPGVTTTSTVTANNNSKDSTAEALLASFSKMMDVMSEMLLETRSRRRDGSSSSSSSSSTNRVLRDDDDDGDDTSSSTTAAVTRLSPSDFSHKKSKDVTTNIASVAANSTDTTTVIANAADAREAVMDLIIAKLQQDDSDFKSDDNRVKKKVSIVTPITFDNDDTITSPSAHDIHEARIHLGSGAAAITRRIVTRLPTSTTEIPTKAVQSVSGVLRSLAAASMVPRETEVIEIYNNLSPLKATPDEDAASAEDAAAYDGNSINTDVKEDYLRAPYHGRTFETSMTATSAAAPSELITSLLPQSAATVTTIEKKLSPLERSKLIRRSLLPKVRLTHESLDELQKYKRHCMKVRHLKEVPYSARGLVMSRVADAVAVKLFDDMVDDVYHEVDDFIDEYAEKFINKI